MTEDVPHVDLYEAMSTLRAVRRLRSDPIPPPVLRRVLQAAAWAPSGGNRQPWRIVAVERRDLKEGLARIYREEWANYVPIASERIEAMPADVRPSWERTLDAGNQLARNFADTPVVLVMCATPTLMTVTDADAPRPSFVAGGSIFPAVQNAMLACRAEGLGCALTTLHCYQEQAVCSLLEIPDEWGTATMMPIGYPERRGHGPITRLPVENLVYRDVFGNSWPS